MNTRRSANLIKSIASGSVKAIQKASRTPVAFIELRQNDNEPGIYYDAIGSRYTEAERAELHRKAQQQSELVFEEIKSY